MKWQHNLFNDRYWLQSKVNLIVMSSFVLLWFSSSTAQNKTNQTTQKKESSTSSTGRKTSSKNNSKDKIKTTKVKHSAPQKVPPKKLKKQSRKTSPAKKNEKKDSASLPNNLSRQDLHYRESAFFTAEDSWQIGIFNPLRLQWNNNWALSIHPMAFLIMPHVEFIHRWWHSSQAQFNFIYGLSDPSWSLTQSMPFGVQGFLSPNCKVATGDPDRTNTCQQSGKGLVPKLGIQWSIKEKTRVWTIEADWSAGFMLNGNRPQPLHTYAPIEVKFAGLTHNHLTHWGVRVAQKLGKSWSIASEIDSYLMGKEVLHSPWVFSGYMGVDYRFSNHHSMTLGLIYWNSDQGAIEWSKDAAGWSEFKRVRSHDFYPCIDFIWSY